MNAKYFSFFDILMGSCPKLGKFLIFALLFKLTLFLHFDCHFCTLPFRIRRPRAPIFAPTMIVELWKLRLDIKIFFSKFQPYAMTTTFVRVSLYMTLPLWEVNFSKSFFKIIYVFKGRFRFFSKKCVNKLLLLFFYSDGNMAKIAKNPSNLTFLNIPIFSVLSIFANVPIGILKK